MSDDAIEKWAIRQRELAAEFGKAQGQRDYLEEFKKSKLAILMKKYESKGFSSAAAQEREARADSEYIELIGGLQIAVENAERIRWELKTNETAIEIWRTRQASRRAEQKGYGA
jgi:hypothetical protein